MNNTINELPDEVLHRILGFVTLEDLLIDIRLVSRKIRSIAEKDDRWLPILLPPSLAAIVVVPDLSAATNGPALCRLYGQYQQWLNQWDSRWMYDKNEALREEYTTALDGFFALAPWDRIKKTDGEGGAHFLGWLEPMAHQKDEKKSRNARSRRVCSRYHPDQRPSRFYQQRERDEDAFRVFYSTPVGSSEAFDECKPHRYRHMLRPLNIRKQNGGLDARLPDLIGEMYQIALNTACMLLRCYLHETGEEAVTVSALDTLVCNTVKYVRRDAQGMFQGENEDEPVYQLHLTAFREAPEIIRQGEPDVFTTYIVAPHIRPMDEDGNPSESLSWCFSSPADESDDDPASPWVVSTFMPMEYLGHSPTLFVRNVVSSLVYSVFLNGVGLEVCENDPCALNNNDSVEESKTESFLLCPCCLRKLQWMGLLKDVPACLDRIRNFLSAPLLKEASKRDLQVLQEWGHS